MTVMGDNPDLAPCGRWMRAAKGLDDGGIASAASDRQAQMVQSDIDAIGIAGVDDGGFTVTGAATKLRRESQLKRQSYAESCGGDQLGPAVLSFSRFPGRLHRGGMKNDFRFERTNCLREGPGFELG